MMNQSVSCRSKTVFSGFTLIEVMVAILLVTLVSGSLLTSVIVTRQLAEYDKQRLSAISAAREVLEQAARRPLTAASAAMPTQVPLDNFNTPDTADDLQATVSWRFFPINPDGTRGPEVINPTTNERMEVVVFIDWNRTGRRSAKRVTEELHSYFGSMSF